MHCKVSNFISMTLRVVLFVGAIIIAVIACLPYIIFKLPPKMEGTSSIKFKPLSSKFRELIESGSERGASLVVFENGENVFDLVGGYADTRFEVPWSINTLTPVFGSSIMPVSFAFGLLRDRNLINESSTVRFYSEKFPSKYLTIAELLTHMTGFAYPKDQISFLAVRDDFEATIKSLFKKHPVFPSGTHAFHFHTLDLIASDVVANVDIKKRPLTRFFLEEIVWPRGLDLHIGSSPTQMYRIARTYHEHPLTYLDAAARLDFRRLWHRLFSNGGLRNHAVNIFKDYELRLNYHPDFVEVPLSSVNFFTNARALASLLTYLLPNPGSNPLFSESTLQWMLSPGSVVHDDPVLQRSVQYTKSGLFIESSPEGKPIFGLRDDILGQVAFVDPSRNLTFAYVTNHAHGCSVQRDWILKTLIQGIYACL